MGEVAFDVVQCLDKNGKAYPGLQKTHNYANLYLFGCYAV
jgi:hypothetical protein